MYAVSFIATLHRVETALERALELRAYDRSERPVRIADDAAVAIDDVGELSSVALSNVRIEAYESLEGDDVVSRMLSERIEDGAAVKPDESTLSTAREAGRIEEVGDAVLVPVDDGVPGSRNWWLLAGLLADWLEDLTDGFRRVHRRTRLNAPEHVETAFWTISERMETLLESITRARTLGRYTIRSVRNGATGLIDGAGGIAATLAGGDDA